MRIEFRVARWLRELTFQFDSDVAADMSRHDWEAGVCVEVERPLILMGASADPCHALNHNTRYGHGQWTHQVEIELKYGVHAELQDLPYFGLTLVAGEYDDETGELSVELPPLYQLTWPGAAFNLDDAGWTEVIYQRLASARRHGATELPAPDRIRRSGLWNVALKRLTEGG